MDKPSDSAPAAKRPKKKSERVYGSITIDEIVDAALVVIRRDGVDALSMRNLADELKVSNMAVYYYVKNKDELLNLVIERVSKQSGLPEGPGSFSSRYVIGFYQARNVWRNYPGLSLLAMTKGGNPSADDVTVALKAEGMTERQIQAAIFAMSCHFYGTISLEPYFPGSSAEFEQNVADSLQVLLHGIEALSQANAKPSHPKSGVSAVEARAIASRPTGARARKRTGGG